LLDDQAHEIALRVTDPPYAADAADALRARLADVPLSVQSWSELRSDILALIASNEALMGMLVFIVFLIAGLGVLNTMLVSVMERQKELSIMKALGFSPVTVTALVVLETVVLTVGASLVGLVIGLGLSLYLQYIGWDISDFGEFSLSGVGMANVLRARVAATTLILPLVAMWVIAVFAALHPAIKAARVSPAVGMRAT
ncbi:MAG: ABC transporter permease, partial [Gammaproteobacteria bacterium]